MDAIQGLELALPLAVAFFAALAATPLAGQLAQRIGATDRPTARGVNQRLDMPLLGGIAVAVAFFAGMAAVGIARSSEDASRWSGLTAGALVLVGTGIWDDRFGIRALP